MNTDNVCVKEQLTFLKYINATFLFYCITLLTFAAVFFLAWILKKYTFFDKNKCKIPRGNLPTFPYGNFKDVVNQNTSLHEFLWKYYNRFKRKGYKYGGLFIFTKPVIVLVDPTVIQNVNKNDKAFKNIIPHRLKLDNEKVNKIFYGKAVNTFLEKYNYLLKGSLLLPENVKKDDGFSGLRDFLLESVCLAFGFNSSEMITEINDLLKENTYTSFRYFFSLSYPLFRTSQKKLKSDLKELFLEIMDNRKKNDLRTDDMIQCFIDMYNESNCAIDDIVNDVFKIFAGTLTYSYSTLLLCLYELAKNTEIQEDVLGEVRRFNKKSLPITYGNLKELTYLDAVVKETLRKYPPVPTVSRSYDTDQEFSLQLPKDTLVFISILAIHRDPQNYTKPDEFDPERFMEECRYVKPSSFIPFGIGLRSQIDMQFTPLQVKLALISIFSSLRVSLKDDSFSNLKIDPKLRYLGVCENFSLEFNPL